MSELVFDIEANGLYEQATKVHCIVAHDLVTKKDYSFDTDRENIQEGLKLLSSAEQLIAHNCIAYDLRVLQKLHKFTTSARILDTYILSMMLQPERKGHGLAAFGERFGIPKPEHEDWETFTPEMLHRCKEDVRINVLTYKALMDEAYEAVTGVPYDKIFAGRF